ncbi:hypothetical protein, conserved [Eimeria acervulina]|uniref:Uncharacterized protein n=1 Tax=Eimeria acervulina TaxID=5801 RepID=U6GM06_EIMAC|nr:hypothetical protein, conserved [Eimeria acervulina]CDI80323.1 hypothetical protein, conserved [Eimeria acervulina]
MLLFHRLFHWTLRKGATPEAERNAKDEDGASAATLSFSGGLFEYRKVGTELVGLWREYTAMNDAISHLLRDYNVVLRQEKRVELVGLMQQEHKAAEAALRQQQEQQEKQQLLGGAPRQPVVLPLLLYGETARLKELKKQMRRADKKLGKIPDYRKPEKNAMMIRVGTPPVNVAKALARPSASLFHKTLYSYKKHLHSMQDKYQSLCSLLEQIKFSPDAHARNTLIQKTAELANFFDSAAPNALRLPNSK